MEIQFYLKRLFNSFTRDLQSQKDNILLEECTNNLITSIRNNKAPYSSKDTENLEHSVKTFIQGQNTFKRQTKTLSHLNKEHIPLKASSTRSELDLTSVYNMFLSKHKRNKSIKPPIKYKDFLLYLNEFYKTKGEDCKFEKCILNSILDYIIFFTELNNPYLCLKERLFELNNFLFKSIKEDSFVSITCSVIFLTKDDLEKHNKSNTCKQSKQKIPKHIHFKILKVKVIYAMKFIKEEFIKLIEEIDIKKHQSFKERNISSQIVCNLNELKDNKQIELLKLPKENNKRKKYWDLDGNEIPYWYYKYKKYNKIYTCELCNNKRFRGSKQFNKHFREPGHLSGLRQLGIQQFSAYNHLTGIDDILKLQNKINEMNFIWNEEYESKNGDILMLKRNQDEIANKHRKKTEIHKD